MNDKIVWLKIEAKNYYKILIKLNELGIKVFDNKKIDNNLFIKTTIKDYNRIKKYLVSYNVTIYDYSGIEKGKRILKKYLIFALSSILSIIILVMTNNIVFKIDIKSPNESIRNRLYEELEKNGLKRMTFKKSHKDIEKIVSNILEDNKDIIEWLEIKYDGLIMVVNVTEKTITKKEEVYPNCNIVSKVEAKITSLNLYRGVALKEINDYVNKGEVIISGSIMHNDEVKDTVCASGEVYGEVWYMAKVTIPFSENYIEYTGKNRFNLSIKINDEEYKIFKSRIKNKKEEVTTLYKLNDFAINLIKEKEYQNSYHVLSEEEAYNKGIDKAVEKIKLKLDKDEEIILKKVLKKEVKDSKIYLEVFIVTKENIGTVEVVRELTGNDSKSNWKNNE